MFNRQPILITSLTVLTFCSAALGGQTPKPEPSQTPAKASKPLKPLKNVKTPKPVPSTQVLRIEVAAPAMSPLSLVVPVPKPAVIQALPAPVAQHASAPETLAAPQPISPMSSVSTIVAVPMTIAPIPEPAVKISTPVVVIQTKPPAVPKPRPAPRPKTPAPAHDPDEQQSEPVVAPLSKGGTVLVSTRGGDVNITGWDQEKVEASTDGGEAPKIETNNPAGGARQRLVISLPGYRGGVTLTIKVPRYADVEMLENLHGDISVNDIEGAVRIGAGQGDASIDHVGSLRIQRRGGDVTARNIKGDVYARGGQGDVVVENAGKSVDVAVGTGDLSIKNAGGDVRVNSATGDVDIRCAKGRADVSTASGSITLVGINGDVEASTASGDVSFAGVLKADGSYRLKSVSGEVQMTIPADSPGFNATLITYTGAIETEFPLKMSDPYHEPVVNRRITGTYGNGSAKLTLDSFSGEVRIIKSKNGAIKECK